MRLKETTISRKYKETCAAIKSERTPVCSSCERWQGGEIVLSFSHLVSRADCKRIGMHEWIFAEWNIQLHCLDWMNHQGCHRQWEDGTKKGADFLGNMRRIVVMLEPWPDMKMKYLNKFNIDESELD